MGKMFVKCERCGMSLISKNDYHPYAACIMYWQTRQGEKVENWLQNIVRYGMLAQEQGLSLNEAIRDMEKVKVN